MQRNSTVVTALVEYLREPKPHWLRSALYDADVRHVHDDGLMLTRWPYRTGTLETPIPR